jgi:hypothetical protein
MKKPDVSREQQDKFMEAARAAECDEDETRWRERLKRIAVAKPEAPNVNARRKQPRAK